MERTRNDVFVSYASSNKGIADALVARLEAKGIRCWYAPRDVLPGVAYPSAILEAIRESRILIVILSTASNESSHVITEVERAVNLGLHIIPVRIESITPTGDLEYLLARRHWLDALPPPVEGHIDGLAQTVSHVLAQDPDWQRGAVSQPESMHAPVRSGRRLAGWTFLAGAALLLGYGAWLRFGAEARPESPDRWPATSHIQGEGPREDPPAPEPRIAEQSSGDEEQTSPGRSDPGGVQQPDPEGSLLPDTIPGTPHPGHESPGQVHPATPEWTTVRNDEEVLIKRLEGTIDEGGQEGRRAMFEVPFHGVARFQVHNTTPEGPRDAVIDRYRIDGKPAGGLLRPGNQRSSRFQAVRAGQGVLIQFEARPGHRTTYAIEAVLKRIGPLPPSITDGRGVLESQVEGALGFDREREHRWEYRAPGNGSVQFALKNTMPDRTDFANIASFLIDQRPVGGLRPDDRRSSRFRTVREGQAIHVTVAASDEHHATYRLEAAFRELEFFAPEPEIQGNLPIARAGGALGFDRPREQVFHFLAPESGKVRFTIQNSMPKDTEAATIARCLVDDRPAGSLSPGKRVVTKYQAVQQGGRVKITLTAQAEHSAVYTIEPEFEADPSQTPAAPPVGR